MNFKTKWAWALPVLSSTILLAASLSAVPAAAQTPLFGSASKPGGMGSGGGSSGGMSHGMNSGMSSGMNGGAAGANGGSSAMLSPGMGSTAGTAANPNGASGASGMNTASGNGNSGSPGQKAARPLKKIKVTHAPAVPDKYADYQWGASDSGDTASLYQPKWSTPQDDYTWGATQP